MLSENHEVIDSNNIVLVVSVVAVKELKDLEFDTSLILELLFISNNLDSTHGICLMI